MEQPTLPRICISATGSTADELFESARTALEHSPFVELRLDWLANPTEGLSLLPSLLRLRKRGSRLQATCRRLQNGGRFRGTVPEQMEILRKAAAAGCRLLDLEIESAEVAGKEAVAELRRHAGVVLSFHDFQRTPSLGAVARRLRRFPADFYKLVATATHQSDNCAILDFLGSATEKAEGTERTEGGKWIAFCMGETGIPSRVLALARGSAFVYAACPPCRDRCGSSSREEESTLVAAELAAPGQIDWDILRNGYRAETLSSRSAIYGLLGCPVRHSVGAAIHNAAFQASGVDAVYLPLLASDLKAFRKAAECYPLAGFSVTIPHKQAILRLVDRVDRSARAAGAANAVRVRRGKWEAINTDIEGIVVPLRKSFRLSESALLPAGFRAVIVGNGGAARAAFVALQELRCRNISIMGRNPVRVAAFARQMGGGVVLAETLERERFDLLVHATSVGMWPRSDECFLRPEQINAGTVFDLVYNPMETHLLQLARARGRRAISGLEMFLAQAARQFEFWTGAEAPRRLMRQTAQRELARLQPFARKEPTS